MFSKNENRPFVSLKNLAGIYSRKAFFKGQNFCTREAEESTL